MPDIITLPGLSSMVAVARHAVRVLLEGYPCADDAILIVSELCTNAIRHTKSSDAGGAFQVSVEAKRGLVRIEVTDDGSPRGFSGIAPVCDLEEYGRGLEIVEVLSTRWGHDKGFGYATVWAEIEDEAEHGP
jgi:serine/threonine-protein kinase RsbW